MELDKFQSKTIVLDPEMVPVFAKYLAQELKAAWEEERKSKEDKERLDTEQISEIYGYGVRYWREKISSGLLGRKDRHGKLTATIKEVEKYLFNKK